MLPVSRESRIEIHGTFGYPRCSRVAERRAPLVATVGMKGGSAGLYEMSPDHNAIIGESHSVGRFLYATGFSGHGFLQGPAVGEILRDLYLRRAPFVDVAPLSAERFELGAARPEFNVVQRTRPRSSS